MSFFAIPLILLNAVILIVSLTYVITTNRNKEKLALLEKGLDPKDYFKDRFFLYAVKAGMCLIGIGLGFLSALIIDEFILIGIDNPAIYPACIFISTGISLVIYYQLFKQHESNENN